MSQVLFLKISYCYNFQSSWDVELLEGVLMTDAIKSMDSALLKQTIDNSRCTDESFFAYYLTDENDKQAYVVSSTNEIEKNL